jgi:hypothetical protein
VPWQWNPCFPVSWQTSSLRQADCTGASPHSSGIPCFPYKYTHKLKPTV